MRDSGVPGRARRSCLGGGGGGEGGGGQGAAGGGGPPRAVCRQGGILTAWGDSSRSQVGVISCEDVSGRGEAARGCSHSGLGRTACCDPVIQGASGKCAEGAGAGAGWKGTCAAGAECV